MSRSSEEVLLIVNHVKNKKCEGTLYLMGQRMAWMQGSKNTFTVSHNYADIRVQKISPDSKDKVQLQVVMHDGGANTFHFTNPAGRPTQVTDREGAKELLQQLLPKFRSKVNSELEEKNRMLQEDPELFQLYKDLVASGIITAEEFWSNRASKQSSSANANKQEVGVSAAFLADIKPQTDGCNGLKYNLTSDIIESIFRTYPAVRKKHAESVPEKLTEQEFWTRFFQSHYFHRDRINFSSKDLFADCAKTDELDIQEAISQNVDDSLVNLNTMSDRTMGEGYGFQREDNKGCSNPANASLLRRFNQHSTMVLKACQRKVASTPQPTSNGHQASVNPPFNHINGAGGMAKNDSTASFASISTEDEPPAKKRKLKEKLVFDDLEPAVSVCTAPALRLADKEGYLHGPTPVAATKYTTSEEMISSCQAVAQEMLSWQPQLTHVLPGGSATSVMWELSPGGALMQGQNPQQLNQMVPKELQQELRQLYSALAELLRHFWACFPVNSKALEEKVVRMQDTLQRFQMTKLNPMRDKLHTSLHYTNHLTGHMEKMMEAAYSKFSTWQQRRMHRS